jgi:prepilin-type N-terminal cleavage/methylation domain-containing protein
MKRALQRFQRTTTHDRAFTLIELMAVVLVIALLAVITFGVIGYVQRRMAISTAKAQLSAIEAALEGYKSDWGYYPLTGPGRVSRNQACEGSNNLVLYRALSGAANGKRYLTWPATALRTNTFIVLTSSTAPVSLGIFDPWSKLYNYYNSPTTTYVNVQANSNPGQSNYLAGYTQGGQVNSRTYDLFSYGPDGATFLPGCALGYVPANGYAWYAGGGWPYGNTNSANDDITNWNP